MTNNPYKLNPSKYSTHNLIKHQIGANKTVLDVGCNDGYLGMIADRSNQFYGIDSHAESINTVTKIYRGAHICDLNALERLPWDMKFDVIVFADVLEHLLSPEAVLSFFVNNYLAKNGTIIISVPNIANWQIRLNLLLGRFTYAESGIMDKTHLHFYTFRTAKQFAHSNDLKVVKILYGANIFNPFIRYSFDLLRNLLATSVILICKK